MANAVLQRVWEHSQARGASRCLMLALADVSDARGIAYPGVKYLASMINEKPAYTDKLIDKMIALGELFKIAGSGRGHVTRFAVLCGLPEAKQEQLKGVLQDPFSIKEKGHHSTPFHNDGKKGATPVHGKGALQFEKGATFPDSKQTSFDAVEQAQSPILKKQIHHDPNHDPGDDGDGRTLAFLIDMGFGAADEFAHLPFEQTKQDYYNRKADNNQSNAIIVKAWRRKPPTKDYHYEQPEQHRSAGRAPAQPAPPERPAVPANLKRVSSASWKKPD